MIMVFFNWRRKMKTNNAKKIELGDKHKKEVVFERPMEGEVDKILNDQRKNKAQAIFDYYREMMSFKKSVVFQKRYEDHIEAGGEVKDHLGLAMSNEEKRLEAHTSLINLKMLRSNVKYKLDDIKKTWNMTDEEVEETIKSWYAPDGKIY